jgi:hypothetical protein
MEQGLRETAHVTQPTVHQNNTDDTSPMVADREHLGHSAIDGASREAVRGASLATSGPSGSNGWNGSLRAWREIDEDESVDECKSRLARIVTKQKQCYHMSHMA